MVDELGRISGKSLGQTYTKSDQEAAADDEDDRDKYAEMMIGEMLSLVHNIIESVVAVFTS